MSFLDAFMAGVRLVESGSHEGDYQAVNRKPRPGGPSLAFGAYQMLFYYPEIHDEPQGFIPYLMSQAGVVGDIRQHRLDKASSPQVYLPIAQQTWTHSMSYVLRTGASPSSLLATVQDAVWSVDGNVPITRVMMMDEVI